MASIETTYDGGIATITLNRPEKLNAFAGTMREDLLAAIEQTAVLDHISVTVITGAGRGFCAGGDVVSMSELQERRDSAGFARLLEAGGRAVMAIRAMPQFVIASVNGVAAGAGCNLALACDYRIASNAATFSESFIRIGLHPDWGGSWLLPRLVGAGRAMEMCLTGRPVPAQEAREMGLVDRVVEAEQLREETAALAAAVASMPRHTVRLIKQSILGAEERSLPEQVALESERQQELFASDDARERILAFARRK
jgi:2-(1,2-epoxy-1,2-dihydrophenyl)acetyl-CoA isomerase